MTDSHELQKFTQFYSNIYQNNWPAILEGLIRDRGQIVRPNLWADPAISYSVLSLDPIREEPKPSSNNNLMTGFIMDRASAMIPHFLDVRPGQHILDMCAAPGGKSLILIELMQGRGDITLNDISDSRRYKLKNIINSYLPDDIRSHIKVSGEDGSKFGIRKKDTFDRILLDAPCSSEAHILSSPKALSNWSPARSRQLAFRQFSLICSAVQALKPSGKLLYSTCSICPAENDEIIRKLVKRKKHPTRVLKIQTTFGEETEFGRMIFPHKHGCGPMYCALIEKLDASP